MEAKPSSFLYQCPMNYEFFPTPVGGNQVLFLALCEVPFRLLLPGGSLPSFGPPHMPMLVSTLLNAGGERPPRSLEVSSEQLFPVLPCPVNSHRLVLPESPLPSQLRKPTGLCPDPSPQAMAWKLSQGVVCRDSGGLFSVSQKDLFLACLASHQTSFQTF